MLGAVGVILEDVAELICTIYVELSLKPAALVGATTGGYACFSWLSPSWRASPTRSPSWWRVASLQVGQPG